MVVHGPYPVGEPRVAREAMAALHGGFEVDVVAMRNPGEASDEVVDGVRVHRLQDLRSSRSRPSELAREYLGFSALAVNRVARLHRERRYSVVQIHNPPDFLIAAAVVPRLTGARVVFDIHDLSPELLAARMAKRPGASAIARVLRWVESAAVRMADAVVTVHEPYRAELLARGVPARKIVVVLNALDEKLVPDTRPDPQSGDFRIVYHGTITRHYGVDVLVDALASVATEIPDAHLEIYGSGDAVPDVRARIEAHRVADRVDMTGRILPHEDVLAKVNGASVGVVAQLPIARNLQALPTKLLEYVALGVPVVASDVPAIRNSFGADELVFFRGGDSASLANALRTVAASPDASRRRADAASARYQAEFRWAIYAQRYLDLLERLIVSG
jgi:glycosyltransferase involved in cell wall biosynthesis